MGSLHYHSVGNQKGFVGLESSLSSLLIRGILLCQVIQKAICITISKKTYRLINTKKNMVLSSNNKKNTEKITIDKKAKLTKRKNGQFIYAYRHRQEASKQCMNQQPFYRKKKIRLCCSRNYIYSRSFQNQGTTFSKLIILWQETPKPFAAQVVY